MEILTVKAEQVAEHLNISPSTFYRRCNAGYYGKKYTYPGQGKYRLGFTVEDVGVVLFFNFFASLGVSEEVIEASIPTFTAYLYEPGWMAALNTDKRTRTEGLHLQGASDGIARYDLTRGSGTNLIMRIPLTFFYEEAEKVFNNCV